MNTDHVDVKNLKPGDELTLEGWVVVTQYGSLMFTSFSADNYIKIAPASITVTVPDGFNGIQASVEAIDKQIQAHKDELQKKISPLVEYKNSLLQLSYGGNDILDKEA